MSDDLSPDDSSLNSQNDSSHGPDPEEDLDSLLAEAAALATEVSEELGRADEPPEAVAGPNGTAEPEPTEPDGSSDSKQDTSVAQDDIDSQLAQVDDFVRDTVTEIGATKEPSPEENDPKTLDSKSEPDIPSDPPSDPPDSQSSGSFYDEFTQPSPEAEDPQAPGESNVEPQPAEDQVLAKVGVVSSKPTDPEGMSSAPDAGSKIERDEAISGKKHPETAIAAEAMSMSSSASKAGARLSVAAIATCAQCVNMLERLDSRMQWLGRRPRQLIGWAALATLGTSLIALLVSLF